MAVAGGAGDKRVADRLGLKATLYVEEVLAEPREDVVGELVRGHQVRDGRFNPEGERDRTIFHLGLADQMGTRDIPNQVLGVDGEAEVRFIIGAPVGSISGTHRPHHVIHHLAHPYPTSSSAAPLPMIRSAFDPSVYYRSGQRLGPWSARGGAVVESRWGRLVA